MKNGNRNNFEAAYRERLLLDHGDLYLWQPTASLLRRAKGIIERSPQARGNGFRRATLRGFSVQKLECSEIVEAGDMIVMLMRVENRFEMRHLMREHLLPKIRAGIDQDIILPILKERAHAQPFIARIR